MLDSLFGIRIIESPLLEPKPKLQLSKACPCSDECRDKFNAWLLERFGREPEHCYMIGKNIWGFESIVMAPSSIVKLTGI